MSKAEWLDKVGHIHAQSAAWFFLFCLVIIGVAIWRDMTNEEKERKRDAQKQTKQGATPAK